MNQRPPQRGRRRVDTLSAQRPQSRPRENHATIRRLSLIEGECRYVPQGVKRNDAEGDLKGFLTETTSHHDRAWLDSNVVSPFVESVYYPYTAPEYHTLVAALEDNHRDGHNIKDLQLIDDDGSPPPNGIPGQGVCPARGTVRWRPQRAVSCWPVVAAVLMGDRVFDDSDR